MKTYPNEALGINDIIKYSHKLFDTDDCKLRRLK